jgi:DNA-binding response OmpR family regulator
MRTSMHILLIDGSASVREVLRLALELEGYRVIEAADGRQDQAESLIRRIRRSMSYSTVEDLSRVEERK